MQRDAGLFFRKTYAQAITGQCLEILFYHVCVCVWGSIESLEKQQLQESVQNLDAKNRRCLFNSCQKRTCPFSPLPVALGWIRPAHQAEEIRTES